MHDDLNAWWALKSVEGKRGRDEFETGLSEFYRGARYVSKVVEDVVEDATNSEIDIDGEFCGHRVDFMIECIKNGTFYTPDISQVSFAASNIRFEIENLKNYVMVYEFTIDLAGRVDNLGRYTVYPDLRAAKIDADAEFRLLNGISRHCLIVPFGNPEATPDNITNTLRACLKHSRILELDDADQVYKFAMAIQEVVNTYGGGYISTNWTYDGFFSLPPNATDAVDLNILREVQMARLSGMFGSYGRGPTAQPVVDFAAKMAEYEAVLRDQIRAGYTDRKKIVVGVMRRLINRHNISGRETYGAYSETAQEFMDFIVTPYNSRTPFLPSLKSGL
jgi:hypothetical protein